MSTDHNFRKKSEREVDMDHIAKKEENIWDIPEKLNEPYRKIAEINDNAFKFGIFGFINFET